MPEIRRAIAADLPEIATIQAASPEAAQWNVADYFNYEFLVTSAENGIAGFVVFRRIAGDEIEILNLAVKPEMRRKRVAESLFRAVVSGFFGAVFLEVRESNAAAIAFYKSMNFQVFSRRENYYYPPSEAAIVLKFHSC
ncbi:MAG TPA: GNAT family N-acetyltransferase [Candidatus Solibacter sp.]|nr:GNAT family N-acetyltransferase [Candidatus Solibacter sp.]